VTTGPEDFPGSDYPEPIDFDEPPIPVPEFRLQESNAALREVLERVGDLLGVDKQAHPELWLAPLRRLTLDPERLTVARANLMAVLLDDEK